ncbi:DUF6090 family protein [Roseivirga sp. E12]|uniref:DUF6090 family protein n=1 Tax=Roseivirga sp. E12 TaxID=2819237 RepID=UPI001ABD0322|nr:DUF6090 family protein [Roseivirga sp. E12]MBO3700254.1 hypothetical protein [Roseivirga sp. E12]
MLNFLRKLRSKEMSSTRYLKYALGEILLVVIGILIALSINNWNEGKKARTYELKMLDEIEDALNQDIPSIERFDSILNIWNKSIIYLTKEVNQANQPSGHWDSIHYHLETIDQIGIFSIYNDGPYEALKSSGMDRISNDRLRNDIARLYSRDLPSLDIWVNEIQRQHIFIKHQEMDELFNTKISIDGSRMKEELVIADLSFLKNPKFHDMIRRTSNIVNSSRNRMKATVDRMKSVRNEIHEEITH